ncbi:hypothetical protein SD70_02325 [Gordoniibacillus kamchatkensis]|uniref:Transcriptional regulator n=1 Tax=Gordoniibacillus kamchatkensis TaxID=1590651 RepID=A0ABR5AML2_9BACL|nr:hypothetical protein SD70_02325 [Paenibacillus sp. VKM B-2647]
MVQQISLFPEVTVKNVERTLMILEKYPFMKILMRDYEDNEHELFMTDVEGETARRYADEDTHADKTPNAVIYREKRKAIYLEYKIYTRSVERACSLILDPEVRKAIHYRFIEGHRYKDAILFFRRSMSEATFNRKINEGVKTIAHSLLMFGVLDREWNY